MPVTGSRRLTGPLRAWVVLVSVLFALVLDPSPASAAAYTSAQSGDWAAAGTWTPAGVPGPGDTVTILSGHLVTVTTNVSVDAITIDNGGTLANNGALFDLR